MNLSPLPIQKFFDNNGNPLDGGLLFTYVSGTATKIATYKNSGGTLNTNPVVLDFRGECRLWIDPTLSYTFVLAPADDTDPPGNAFWTVDDITAGPASQDNAANDTGSVNNIELSIPQISSPVAFTRVVFKAANTNTGPVTISINGGTAHDLTWQNIGAFAGGEIQAGGIYEAIFDATQWQLQGPALDPTQLRTVAEIAAGVTPSNFSIPSHEAEGVFYPARYGALGDAAANGQTGTDDTAALRTMALVINQAGGGTVNFRPGAYYRVMSATTGNLIALTSVRGVNIQGNGCTLVVPTNKAITTSEGSFFSFTTSKNITVNGFNTNGPTLDVSSTTVKGYEFTHFVGCEEIYLPENNVVNALAGAIFYGQNGSGVPVLANRTKNIWIGVLRVTNCWYGINSQFSGDNLVFENLITDTIHRSIFMYGFTNVRGSLRSKDFKARDIVAFAWNDNVNGSQPMKDFYIDYHVQTDSSANAVNGDRIYFGTWGIGPCVLDGIRIRLSVDLNSSGQGGPVALLTKLNNSFNPDSTAGRGHIYRDIEIDGYVLGNPDTTAGGIVAMDSGANFTGETLSGTWRFAYVTNASSSYNSLSLTQLSGMSLNTVLNISGMNASAPAAIPIQEGTAALELPHNPRIILDAINCSNRYSNTSGPILALEWMNAGSTTPTAYAGWCFGTLKYLTTRGAGGTTTWALPAATVGMRIGLIRTDAQVTRLDPNGTEIIRGGGAGKYIQTNTDGASLELYCQTAGIWDIRQQIGTFTYEP